MSRLNFMAILAGKALAAEILQATARRAKQLKPPVGLAVILVGQDPASAVYVRQKRLAAKQVGFRFRELNLPQRTSEKALLTAIANLNQDRAIDGFLVQLPLPSQIALPKVVAALKPAKDVDGFTPENLGRGFLNLPGLLPATPAGILALLQAAQVPLKGQNVVIIGHSMIVGRPLALLLTALNATVTVCHEFTKKLADFTRRADVLISATGVPNLVTGRMLKKGVVAIDVGCTKSQGKLTGDLDFASCRKQARWITPVPGGVGPLTVATLMQNTLQAAEEQRR